MDNQNILTKIWGLKSSWMKILSCCGDYYLGNNLQRMILSFVTYKRICDIASKNPAAFDVRELGKWEGFINAKSKYQYITNAVDAINYENFARLAYGEYLIPRFPYFSEDEQKEINKVLNQWVEDFSAVNLNELTEEDWHDLSKLLRKGMHQ